MKSKLNFMATLFAVALTVVLSACDNDDDNKVKVPESVSQSLQTKYPAATHVEWEVKGDYYVADCRMDGKEMDVWFDKQTEWVLTEIALVWNDLPAAVQTTFSAGEYASWKKDEYCLLEYALQPIQYVIEVEQGSTEIQLFYSESGELMQTRDVTGKDDTHWPVIYGGE